MENRDHPPQTDRRSERHYACGKFCTRHLYLVTGAAASWTDLGKSELTITFVSLVSRQRKVTKRFSLSPGMVSTNGVSFLATSCQKSFTASGLPALTSF